MLPQDEFRMGDGCVQQLRVKSPLRQALYLREHQRLELLLGLRFRSLELHHDEGLEQGIHEAGMEVIAQLRVDHRPLERGFVGTGNGIHQDIHSQGTLHLMRGTHHIPQRQAGIIRSRDHLPAGIHLDDGLLEHKRIHGCALRGGRHLGEIPLVQKRQHARSVHRAVEDDIGVICPVVALMGIQECLIGEVRDGRRRTTGFEAIGGVWEQRC